MKIGILTLPLHTNYGGILQAWALQTVLERMGHEVEVIDKSRYRYLPWYKAIIKIPVRIFRKYLLGQNVGVFFESWFNNRLDEDKPTMMYTQPFIDSHIHQRHIIDFKEIEPTDYDAIVVGSDQIWRTVYADLFLQSTASAYLDFANGWKIKKIAYAASFGTDEWEYSPKDTIKCKSLLKNFDAVSVREKSGVNVCAKYLDYSSALHVVDPTMLLDSNDYSSLIAGKATQSHGNLMCYVLDESKKISSIIDKISVEKQLTPFRVNSKVEDHNAPLSERIQPPVEQWLQGFADSELVITDSFHACVFSILFKKQFLVVGNKDRGMSRFDSLLETFGLNDRMIMNEDQLSSIQNIDYDAVYSILNEKKREARNFLNEYLS